MGGGKIFSTSVGVQGIPEYADYGIEIADTAEAFSRKIIAWLDTEKNSLLKENELFKEHYSRKKCYGELFSCLQLVRKNGIPHSMEIPEKRLL